MMKINWKVRVKNPVFWATVVPAFVGFVYTLLGAFDIVPAISSDEVINYITLTISALTTLGVLVDPTTKGLGDSERAQAYESPADSDFMSMLEKEQAEGIVYQEDGEKE